MPPKITACEAVVPVPSEAGTFFLGAKGWYCTWDSGILDWLEKDIALSFLGNRVQFQAEDNPGSGYLAGPLDGYQTDNGKWSFSFAAMVFSHFNQDWSGSAAGMNLGGAVDLSRRDYDLAANYNLSQYFNVYAGLKYQDMEMDYTLSTTTVIGPQTDRFSVDAEALMLSLGIGGAYPLHPKLVVSGQAGESDYLNTVPASRFRIETRGLCYSSARSRKAARRASSRPSASRR